MSTIWIALIAVAAINAAIKGIGPAILGGRQPPPRVTAVVALLAPALLAALVITQALASDGRYRIDERAAGVAVAGIALLLRAPMVIAMLLGVITAAGLRALIAAAGSGL